MSEQSMEPRRDSALQLARVSREIETMKESEATVLNLNYCSLREIPEELLCSEYCRGKLQKLYLKRNCIISLVILKLLSPHA